VVPSTAKPNAGPGDLPQAGESEKEHKSSLKAFFILIVVGLYFEQICFIKWT
jgi:hypothetical protein